MQGNQEVRTVTANFFQEKQREIDNTCIEFKHMTHTETIFFFGKIPKCCLLPPPQENGRVRYGKCLIIG